MIEALVGFLIILVVIVVVAALVLWAIRSFLPEFYTPARLIVGAVAVIAILFALLELLRGQSPRIP
jgi:hypothetical protein